MSDNQTGSQPTVENPNKENIVRWGGFVALLFAMVFFSGLLSGKGAWSVLDFTTLNGAFGRVAADVTAIQGDVATVGKTTYKGVGGRGAMEGFLFAFGLIPAVMFALAMINVLEHYGALNAARVLLTPILRPLLGIPGSCGLALIGSLQSTDVGASLTRQLSDENMLSENQRDVFIMFQFSAGAMITNFFSSGAVLFTLMMADGKTPVVPVSLGLCIAVMFVMKIVGANILRLIFSFSSKKAATA